MPEIEIVVAVARGGVIGADGTLPWHIPSELKRFKQLTIGKPIVMGRKTWESLPKRPLPGRTNIVVTQQSDYRAAGAVVVHSKEEALAAATGGDRIAIIGGGQIYQMFLADAVRVYLTVVDADFPGDTFFPALPAAHWRDTVIEKVGAGSSPGAPAYEVHLLERKAGG